MGALKLVVGGVEAYCCGFFELIDGGNGGVHNTYIPCVYLNKNMCTSCNACIQDMYLRHVCLSKSFLGLFVVMKIHILHIKDFCAKKS